MSRNVVIAAVMLAWLAWPGVAGDEPPATIELGDVEFPHALHAAALELPCGQCHHETEAAELDIPHEEYFEDFWIQCKICHRSKPLAEPNGICSDCHRVNPFDIADETLSAKVVIHRSCWECHAVGTGREAAASCGNCHARKRRAESTSS